MSIQQKTKTALSALMALFVAFAPFTTGLPVMATNDGPDTTPDTGQIYGDASKYYGDTLLDEYIAENYAGKITVAIAAQRMIPNSRLAFDLVEMLPGHTIIRLDTGGGEVIVVGFTSVNTLSLQDIMYNTTVEGSLKDETGRDWNAAIIYEITDAQAHAIKEYIENFDDVQFNLIFNNCTTFAVNALAAAGLPPPTEKHYWTLPSRAEVFESLPDFVPFKEKFVNELMSRIYHGYTPADAVQDFKSDPNCILKYDGALHKP